MAHPNANALRLKIRTKPYTNTLPTILKKTLYFILTILLFSCSNQQKLENKNGIFTENEFQELKFLLQSFDRILCNESETYSTKIAYWEYTQRVDESNSVPLIKGIDSLGKSVINYKVFEKIWWKYKSSKSNKFNYNFAEKSNYYEFLKLVGKESDFIKSYAENLELMNDLTPSVVSGFSRNIKKIDLENENFRLIFAIHYLTLLNR